MILVSNDIDEIEYLCDKVSLFKKGKIIFNDTIEQLKIDYSIGYIFKLNLKKKILIMKIMMIYSKIQNIQLII